MFHRNSNDNEVQFIAQFEDNLFDSNKKIFALNVWLKVQFGPIV